MKKISLLLGIILMFLSSSCREVTNAVLDALPPFNVPFSTTLNVPFAAMSTTEYTRTPEIPLSLDLDAAIKKENANYSIVNLKSVKLSAFSISYESSELGNKLDVIKNMKVFIKAGGLSEKLIASHYNNTNPESIVFTTEDVELAEYFKKQDKSLIIEVQGNRITVDKIRLKLNSSFKVKVEL